MEVPSSDKYYDFEDGVALYKQGDKVGLFGTDGKVVLEPTYDAIKKFRNGHAKVKKGDSWGMIDKTGKVVIPVEYEEIGNEYNSSGVEGKKNGEFGIVSNGKFHPIAGADKVWGFYGDAALTYARKDKKIGFVNNKGEWVIEPQFDKARGFAEGLAPVAEGKTWGYIDQKGSMVIDFEYRDAEVFSKDGLAPVKQKMWGFIDKSGKMVIPMEYDITAGFAFLAGKDTKGFIDGLARVKTKKGWGFLDKTGKLLADKWFQNAEPFTSVN